MSGSGESRTFKNFISCPFYHLPLSGGRVMPTLLLRCSRWIERAQSSPRECQIVQPTSFRTGYEEKYGAVMKRSGTWVALPDVADTVPVGVRHGQSRATPPTEAYRPKSRATACRAYI